MLTRLPADLRLAPADAARLLGAARDNGADLATRDLRAKATYDTVGVCVLVAG